MFPSLRSSGTSSSERLVTIFWQKTSGRAVVGQYDGDEFVCTATKTISLETGYLTTAISMKMNTFQFIKKAKNDTLGTLVSSVSVPHHDELLSTSSLLGKYTIDSAEKGGLEWMLNEEGPMNITNFVIFWFDDNEGPTAFAHLSPESRGASFEAKPPKL